MSEQIDIETYWKTIYLFVILSRGVAVARNFVEEKLGTKFVESRSLDFAKSFEESGPETAIFFILSPGVDPLQDVEKVGSKLGFSVDNGNFHNISLGQGQESVAECAIDVAAQNGHWVVLQVSLIVHFVSFTHRRLQALRFQGQGGHVTPSSRR